MSISSRLAGLAHRVASAPSAAPVALESVPPVGQPVHTAYVPPFSPPVPPDWRIAASPPTDNPTVPNSAAPRRRIVTWDEVERNVRAAYASQYDQCIGEPLATDNPPPEPAVQPGDQLLDIDPLSVAQGEPILGNEAHLPADRETLPTEPETGTADPSAAASLDTHGTVPVETVKAPTSYQTPSVTPVKAARAMSAKERMAKRRAELKRLGLPAKYRGSLKDLTSVTPPVTPSVTRNAMEATHVQ